MPVPQRFASSGSRSPPVPSAIDCGIIAAAPTALDTRMAVRKPFKKTARPKPAAKKAASVRKSATTKRAAPVVSARAPMSIAAIDRLPDHLLLGPGDAPDRASYFDHDDRGRAGRVGGATIHMRMPKSVSLHDYRRKEDGLRHHRAMVTIPPKLRSNIAKLFGYQDAEAAEVPLTTAMVALADYAAQKLLKEKRLLEVSAPADPFAAERKVARQAVKGRGVARNGKIY